MDIGFLIKDLKVNGANRMILEFAKGLMNRGSNVLLLIENDRWPPWLHSDLPVADIAAASQKSFDVMISTYYTLVPQLDSCRSRCRLQLILDNYYRHDTKSDERRQLIDHAYLHSDSRKVVVSFYLKNLLRQMGVKSHVVHVGIDDALFFEDPAWRDGEFKVLVEGYPRKYKDLPATYGAIPREYLVWGLGIEAHQLRAERMWVRPLQDDLRRIYSACNVLVKLERKGGFPQAPLEAMACGTIVICSDEGGHLDYCVDGFNCLIAQDPSEVSGHLSAAREDHALIERLRENGKATARAFRWHDAAARLFHVIANSL
jgi:O-antigen biosynthesis protein